MTTCYFPANNSVLVDIDHFFAPMVGYLSEKSTIAQITFDSFGSKLPKPPIITGPCKMTILLHYATIILPGPIIIESV